MAQTLVKTPEQPPQTVASVQAKIAAELKKYTDALNDPGNQIGPNFDKQIPGLVKRRTDELNKFYGPALKTLQHNETVYAQERNLDLQRAILKARSIRYSTGNSNANFYTSRAPTSVSSPSLLGGGSGKTLLGL